MITKKKFIFSFEEVCKIIADNLKSSGYTVDGSLKLMQNGAGFTVLIPQGVIRGILNSELNKIGEEGDFQIEVRDSNFLCEERDDAAEVKLAKLLQTPLEDLDLSVRAYNPLKDAKIHTLGDIVRKDPHELLKLRNMGKKTFAKIEDLVSIKGLRFGMEV